MSDPNDALSTTQAYTSTNFVKRTAGIEDDDDDWKNEDINLIIKGVMRVINKELQVTSNLTMPVAEDLQLATAFLSSSVIKLQMKDENKPWKDDFDFGLFFLAQYLKSPEAFAQKFGQMYQSSYLTKPANPNADSYITTGDW